MITQNRTITTRSQEVLVPGGEALTKEEVKMGVKMVGEES